MLENIFLGGIGGVFVGFIIGAGVSGGPNNPGPMINCVFLFGVIGVVCGVVLALAKDSAKEKERQQVEESRREAAAQEKQAEARRQKEAEERARRDARKEKELQEAYCRRDIIQLQSDLQTLLGKLWTLVPAAENHLDRAEKEFAEGAFSPFWDEIEHATKKLAIYQNGIRTIHDKSIEYSRMAARLPEKLPAFSIPTRGLPDGRPTVSRLATIVRQAQKNFQFATIYEQRKTNQILVEGFGTLASAIYEIGNTIASSLDDLSINLRISLNDLLKSQERQEEMLDNIHQGQKPFQKL